MTKHRKKCTASEKLELHFHYNLLGAAMGQNVPVEFYRSIQERQVFKQFEFNFFRVLLATINRFVSFFKFKRIHSGIGYESPIEYILQLDINMKKGDLEEAFDHASSKVHFIN